jgi:radical SAM superfamily enzyme YgiQ (UPF0313 family)
VLAIASALDLHDTEVILFDENRKSIADFILLLESTEHLLCAGFSIMTGGGQIKNAINLATIMKRVHPNAITVFGGPHVNVLPKSTLDHVIVDFVLSGPGQNSFPKFIDAVDNKIDYTKVPGLMTYRDGKILLGEENKLTQSTMFPYEFSFIDINDYIQCDSTIADRTINYVTTQGCSYGCRFCYETSYKKRYSKLPCNVVIDDIKWLADIHGINGIKFYDSEWFIDLHRAMQLTCELSELKINWAASIHPKSILQAVVKKLPLLENLAKSGCKRLVMGIESGNNRVLNNIVNKGISKEEIYEVACQVSSCGILGSYTFIVGFPGETYEEQMDTFNFIELLWRLNPRPETKVHAYMPYPGTPLYDDALSLGFAPPKELKGWSDFDYYKVQTPWTDSALEQKLREFTSMIPK